MKGCSTVTQASVLCDALCKKSKGSLVHVSIVTSLTQSGSLSARIYYAGADINKSGSFRALAEALQTGEEHPGQHLYQS